MHIFACNADRILHNSKGEYEMKKLCAVLIISAVIISLSACSGMSVSNKKYDEIANYVSAHIDTFSSEKEIEFFDYETTGLSIGGVYYGYYYTANNEVRLPDFYKGNDLYKIKNDKHEADGGVYFGKPNNGTDWCYIKEITDHWYYYELHWA